MPVPISSSKSQDLLTGLPEPPFVQAHFSIRIECVQTYIKSAELEDYVHKYLFPKEKYWKARLAAILSIRKIWR